MSSFTCCGCWPSFIQGFPSSTKSARTYRRAKYNEREYTIEFENLIEEEDFYAPAQHAVTEVERDLLSKGKFVELLQHETDIIRKEDEKLKEREENARLEDEAYIQAKKEASRVARQAMKKTVNEKSKFPNIQKFDSVEFSKWLSEEKIDITSPELDVEDFESFLEKVRAKSAQALADEGKNKDANVFEQTLSQGLAATKIAGDALNALQPVELHAVGMPSFNHAPPDVTTTEPIGFDSNFTITESIGFDSNFAPTESIGFDSNFAPTESIGFDSNFAPTESIGFDPNFSEPEEDQLLSIPDVEIKSDDTVILSSQVPVTSAPAIVEPEPTNHIFHVDKDAEENISSDTPVTLQPLPLQSLPEEVDISPPKCAPEETLVTFSPDISESSDLDSVCIDSLSATQLHVQSMDSLSDFQPVLSDDLSLCVQMNTLPLQDDTNENLIDISPDTVDFQLLPVEHPSPVIQNLHVQDVEPQTSVIQSLLAQDERCNPVEELTSRSLEVSEESSEIQVTEQTDTPLSSSEMVNGVSEIVPNVSEIVSIATVATINTPRNVATHLKPTEDTAIDNLPSKHVDVDSFKMVTPASNGPTPIANDLNNSEILEDSLNDDDDFNDFDDDFVSSNSNAAFEDYLT